MEDYIIDETNYTGSCPDCKFSWDLGEYPDYLMNLRKTQENNGLDLHYVSLMIDVPFSKRQDLEREHAEKLARKDGWTPENKLRMSSVLYSEASGGVGFANTNRYHCPNCYASWEAITGKRQGGYTPLEPTSVIQERLAKEKNEKKVE